jgi:hypothetical protein
VSCNRYREMLHLYRPGELSPEELRELDDHLRTCTGCAALKERIARAETTLRTLREFVPAAPDTERAVAAVTHAAGGATRVRRSLLTGGRLDRWLGRFELPAFQLAGALAAVVITAGFLIQQITLLNDVSDLEARLAGTANGHDRLEVAFAVPRLPRELSPELDRILHAAGGAIGMDARGRITISRNRAADLARIPLQQLLAAAASEKMIGLDRKALTDINGYLTRNITTVLQTTRRGGTR